VPINCSSLPKTRIIENILLKLVDPLCQTLRPAVGKFSRFVPITSSQFTHMQCMHPSRPCSCWPGSLADIRSADTASAVTFLEGDLNWPDSY